MHGAVGRKEKKRSSSSKGIGGVGHCADSSRTTKGHNKSIKANNNRARGPEITFL